MREKGPFSCIWTEYGEMWSISPYSVQMRKNVDEKNSEYGHFSRSRKVWVSLSVSFKRFFRRLNEAWLNLGDDAISEASTPFHSQSNHPKSYTKQFPPLCFQAQYHQLKYIFQLEYNNSQIT